VRTAWLVRGRQMETRFAFWLAAVGYDRRDRSLQHRIYLIYALLFMSGWVFAVFTLFASSGAGLLKAYNPANPPAGAADLALKLTLVWAAFTLIQVSRRSPIVFSEDDAYLICQTPLDRRAVALTWFPADWLQRALPFWAALVTLGFSMAEIRLNGNATAGDIPMYVLTGLRALVAFLPIQMGLCAALWAFGALRLSGYGEPPWLRRSAWIGAGAILLGMLPNTPWQVVFWPLSFPLVAGFGLSPWLYGSAVGLALAALGLLALWAASGGLNLSVAAQETTGQAAQQAASRLGDFDQAQALRQRERLGLGRPPTRLKAQPGLWVLPWKDAVQSIQAPGWLEILGWLEVLAVALAGALLPYWEGRALAAILWVIFLGQVATRRLREDLAHWSLVRLLPIDSSQALLADLGLSWALGLLLTWLGLIPGLTVLGSASLVLMLLVPVLTATVLLAAAYDILHRCSVSALLAGNAPTVTGRGALLGLVLAAVPLGLLWWLGRQPIPPVLDAIAVVGVSLLTAAIAWSLASSAYQEIQ
jgi:hypothetical protein